MLSLKSTRRQTKLLLGQLKGAFVYQNASKSREKIMYNAIGRFLEMFENYIWHILQVNKKLYTLNKAKNTQILY